MTVNNGKDRLKMSKPNEEDIKDKTKTLEKRKSK